MLNVLVKNYVAVNDWHCIGWYVWSHFTCKAPIMLKLVVKYAKLEADGVSKMEKLAVKHL